MEARDDGLTVERERQVALVPLGLLDVAWLRCREWIEAALAFSQQHQLSVDEVYARLADGEFLLLLMTGPDAMARDAAPTDVRACAVISREVSAQTGRPNIALICAGGAGLDSWIAPLYRAVCDLARAEGCDRVLIVGRPGWRRVLGRFGARHVGEIIVVEL